MATCNIAELIDDACSSGFKCLDQQSFQAILLQLLCNYSASVEAASGFAITLSQYSPNDPVDGTTYYFGSGGVQNTTTYSQASILIPRTGTITRWFLKVIVASTGSAETVQHFLRINDSTDTGQINLTYDAASPMSLNTTINQAVTQGDSLAVKIVSPTWATEPAGVFYYGYVYIE